MSSPGEALGRRSLLKMGTAVLATPLAGAAAEAQPGSSPAATPGTQVFRAQLVPDGADCRLALVSDQHWWPEHRENWGGGAQMTSLSDRKMPDLAEMLNAERPDVSIHAGDVISAAGSFFPTPAEYAKQLAFAKRFYGKHFGWVPDGAMDMGELGKYEFLRHAERAPEGAPMGQGVLGAVMPMMPGMPIPAWSFYFRVPDIDVAAARITEHGGTLFQDPIEIPGGEFSLNASDPQGAMFGLVGPRKGEA